MDIRRNEEGISMMAAVSPIKSGRGFSGGNEANRQNWNPFSMFCVSYSDVCLGRVTFCGIPKLACIREGS